VNASLDEGTAVGAVDGGEVVPELVGLVAVVGVTPVVPVVWGLVVGVVFDDVGGVVGGVLPHCANARRIPEYH
jgi:hypothetical protein